MKLEARDVVVTVAHTRSRSRRHLVAVAGRGAGRARAERGRQDHAVSRAGGRSPRRVGPYRARRRRRVERAALAAGPARDGLRPANPERALGPHGRREPVDVRVARRSAGPARRAGVGQGGRARPPALGARRGAVGRRATSTRARPRAHRQAQCPRVRRAVCGHRPRRRRASRLASRKRAEAGTAVVLADHHVAEALRSAIGGSPGRRSGGSRRSARRVSRAPVGRREVPGFVDAYAPADTGSPPKEQSRG